MFATDDAMLDARVALVKLEGPGSADKLDLFFMTGCISPYHNMHTMEAFVQTFWNDNGVEGESRDWIMQSRIR